jgi:uncharacterized membrane protein YvbJ
MAMCNSCGTETEVNSRTCAYCGAVITDREAFRTTRGAPLQRRAETPAWVARLRMFGALVVSALVFLLISFVIYAGH